MLHRRPAPQPVPAHADRLAAGDRQVGRGRRGVRLQHLLLAERRGQLLRPRARHRRPAPHLVAVGGGAVLHRHAVPDPAGLAAGEADPDQRRRARCCSSALGARSWPACGWRSLGHASTPSRPTTCRSPGPSSSCSGVALSLIVSKVDGAVRRAPGHGRGRRRAGGLRPAARPAADRRLPELLGADPLHRRVPDDLGRHRQLDPDHEVPVVPALRRARPALLRLVSLALAAAGHRRVGQPGAAAAVDAGRPGDGRARRRLPELALHRGHLLQPLRRPAQRLHLGAAAGGDGRRLLDDDGGRAGRPASLVVADDQADSPRWEAVNQQLNDFPGLPDECATETRRRSRSARCCAASTAGEQPRHRGALGRLPRLDVRPGDRGGGRRTSTSTWSLFSQGSCPPFAAARHGAEQLREGQPAGPQLHRGPGRARAGRCGCSSAPAGRSTSAGPGST